MDIGYYKVNYYKIHKETPKAYLIQFEDDEEPEWVPKSACILDKEEKTAQLKDWLYEKLFLNG